MGYALFTAITILILGMIGLALLWYLYFWSNWLPNQVADGLLKTSPILSPYLDQTSPDQAGLNNWLQEVILGENLVISIPTEKNTDNAQEMAVQFGRLISIAIVDDEGRVLAAAPQETITTGVILQSQLLPDAVASYQAALGGETNPPKLAIRRDNGHMLAAAPIFSSDKQVLGAILVEVTMPFEEGEFLQLIFQETILPVALGMLVVGLIAGIFFGFFIARGLTRRLYLLTTAADAWSKGDFVVLVEDKSGDELGQLARHLNHMAIQLQNLMQTRQELASLEERNRLARDLHDSVKQQVFATSMQVGAALALMEQNPAAAKARLVETEQLVRQAQQELTGLIQELRPAALEDKGLTLALREYVTDWSRQNSITTEIRVSGEQGLPLFVEQTLFRVTQEALANVARHSRATLAEVCLAWIGDQVKLTISDNGRGFNAATVNGRGVGLRSMRERMEAIGGSLAIDSKVGQGTQVIAQCQT